MASRVEARKRWEVVIERWRGSALPLSAFCRKHGVSYTQAVRWRRRLTDEVTVKPAPLTLIPVLAPTGDRGGRLVVRLPAGVGIEVEPGFAPELLRAVVQTLVAVPPC